MFTKIVDTGALKVAIDRLKAMIDARAAEGHGHLAATRAAAGFMSADDKGKLDGIEAGANAYSLPWASGSAKGGVKLSDATNSRLHIGDGTAATPEAVARVADMVAAFEPEVLYQDAYWRVVRAGGILSATALDVTTGAGSTASTTCPYTVPRSLRPAKGILAPMVTDQGGSCTGTIKVSSSGAISAYNAGGTGSASRRHGQVVWYPGI